MLMHSYVKVRNSKTARWLVTRLKQNYNTMLKELSRFDFHFPPNTCIYKQLGRNKVYQHTVKLAFILHLRLVLIDHCAIV